MPLTLSAKSYTNDLPRGSDAYRYNGPSNTSSFHDYVDLYRAPAVQNTAGTAKAKGRFKLTRGATNGTVQLATDAIVDIVVSIPVGMATAEIDALINEAMAYGATAAFKTVVKAGAINQ